MTVKVTNMVKFCTLLLLNEGPKHGYELIRDLEKKLNKKISASHVYPFLQTLKKNKYIDIKKTGDRDKKVYSLTNEGKKFVKSTLSRFGGLLDVAIEPRLSVCAHCGCEVYKGGYKEKVKGKNLMFCCKHCARTYKRH